MSTAGPADGRVDAILYDLDGTLVDTRRGIEACLAAALAEAGVGVGQSTFGNLLGLPLDALVAAIAPSLDAAGREMVAAAFVRRYDEHGWRESGLYPGTRSALLALSGGGARQFVVTNKRRIPTEAILRRHGLEAVFEAVYTLDSRTPRFASKAEMAQACIRDHALCPGTTLMVGDSDDDRDAAQACGTLFAAAAWGYGHDRTASHEAAPDLRMGADTGRREVILATMTDLVTLVPSKHIEVGQ